MTPQFTKSLTIIRQLATGVDPSTGELLPSPSIFERPDVIRALYDAERAMERQVRAPQNRRPRPAKAGASWTPEEEQRLLDQFDAGVDPAEIAKQLERSPAGVIARLQLRNRLRAVSWRTNGRSHAD